MSRKEKWSQKMERMMKKAKETFLHFPSPLDDVKEKMKRKEGKTNE